MMPDEFRKLDLYSGRGYEAGYVVRVELEQQVFAEAEVPLRINRVGSMMTLFFNPGEVTGWDTVSTSDRDGFGKFFHRMIEEGVYMPPSPFEAMFVSTAHTDADIQATIDAARRALG